MKEQWRKVQFCNHNIEKINTLTLHQIFVFLGATKIFLLTDLNLALKHCKVKTLLIWTLHLTQRYPTRRNDNIIPIKSRLSHLDTIQTHIKDANKKVQALFFCKDDTSFFAGRIYGVIWGEIFTKTFIFGEMIFVNSKMRNNFLCQTHYRWNHI